MTDENCLASLPGTYQHNPARHLRFLQHVLLQQVVYLRMDEGECATSSSNQFKPSLPISECGRIRRYAVVHVQHGH